MTVADQPLKDRVAIVTGGGRGMGEAHCLELARRGAKVAVLDIDTEVAESVAAVITAGGGQAFGVGCDVTDRASVEAAVAATATAFGGLDIVVSNAGLVNDESGLADTDDAEWSRMLAVNLDGCLNLTRAAVPWLLESLHGRVIVISSTWGQVPPGHSYSYIAAKGALIAFAKNMAVEFAPKGITVNAITPGSIRTRMIPDPERELEMYPIPIGRMAEPVEVSFLVCYLASDEAGFVTGQVMSINGGTPIVGI
jgi:NAD(P)-dependent dehydrogenase (short-subunit alcohol dehydrogenase family)